MKLVTMKAKTTPKLAESANVKQFPTKALFQRNGPTTKSVKNQQMQKTTPKKAMIQTTKRNSKVTTTQKFAQLKKTTSIQKQPRGVPRVDYSITFAPEKSNVNPTVPPAEPFLSIDFDINNMVPYRLNLGPPTTENSTNSTTTELPEEYEYGDGDNTETMPTENGSDLDTGNTTTTTTISSTTLESVVTRKRLKRRRTTTLDPSLATTRRRVKRKRTTTVGPEIE